MARLDELTAEFITATRDLIVPTPKGGWHFNSLARFGLPEVLALAYQGADQIGTTWQPIGTSLNFCQVVSHLALSVQALVDGATVAPDCGVGGPIFEWTVGGTPRTINFPLNLTHAGQLFVLSVLNNTAGAIAITFANVGGTWQMPAWVNPAAGLRKTLIFYAAGPGGAPNIMRQVGPASADF